MTTTTEYATFLAPTGEAREHPEDGINPESPDPEAPWGRKADGTPKAKPGRPSGTPDSNPRTRTRRRMTAAAPPRRTSKPKQPKQQQGPDYVPGLMGWAQIIAAPMAIAGMRSPVWALNAAAVTVHARPIAEGAQSAAEQDPRTAAILDKVCKAGPYTALLTPVVALGVQILANHQIIPPQAAAAMGAMTPDELIAAVQDIDDGVAA